MRRLKRRWPELLLGVLAAALLVCAVCRYIPADKPQPLILETFEQSGTAAAVLDLNDATAEELEALPGIGPVLAERIVAWREENGPFQSREDVLDVKGIGEATYESLAPYVTY